MRTWIISAAVAAFATSAVAQVDTSRWEPGHTGPDGVWVPGRRVATSPHVASPVFRTQPVTPRRETEQENAEGLPVVERPVYGSKLIDTDADAKVEYVYCVGQDSDQVYVSDVQPLAKGRSALDVTSAWQTYLKGRGASGSCSSGVLGKISAYNARDAAAKKVQDKSALRFVNYTLWIG